MKPERAEELYSDYAEGTLTPALRQALEQHFEADPSARTDYARFAKLYSLLEQSPAEVDVPLGFRAKVLERVSAEQVRRETTFSQRAATTFTGWFSSVPHRRLTGGALAAAVLVLGGVVFLRPTQPGGGVPPTSISTLMPLFPAPAPNVDPAVIQQMQTQVLPDHNSYHMFRLHLPQSVPAATVNAYVVTATEQITDPAHLSEATPALQGQRMTNDQSVQIPIAPLQAPPAGATLNLLVQWTPIDPNRQAGSEVVFTPFGAANPATAAPVNANFLDVLQAVASHYGATVVVDTGSVPTQAVSVDFSGPSAAAPLQVAADAAGYAVQALPNNTFYLYVPQS